MIAITRCEDYRHDVYDVTCGSIIGIIVAHWSYRRFFPWLRHENCDVPFSKRSGDGFMKVRDDEEIGTRNGMDYNLDQIRGNEV